MDAYLRDIAVPQVKELFTNYGDIAVLWWDTPIDMTPKRAAFNALLDKSRRSRGEVITEAHKDAYATASYPQ